MKEKILDFINSVVWIVLIVILGILVIEGIRSLTTSNEPAKKIGISVFTEEGHDYLVVDTNYIDAHRIVPKPYTHVLFINGYHKDSQRIEKEIESITIGKPKKGLMPRQMARY